VVVARPARREGRARGASRERRGHPGRATSRVGCRVQAPRVVEEWKVMVVGEPPFQKNRKEMGLGLKTLTGSLSDVHAVFCKIP